MKSALRDKLDALWSRHHAEWRDPAQVVSQWPGAADIDRRLLRYAVRGAWWETLAATGVTLLVTREYEHLVMALRVADEGPAISYLPIPHPSGIAVDRERGVVHLASTRNPNQVCDLVPITGLMACPDLETDSVPERTLVPLRTRFFPGCLYLHDLTLIDGKLYANAVGQNAVVRLYADGGHERVWWPRCIERDGQPVFGQNHIQLNSIAAAGDLAGSYFSASSDRLSARRPGHMNFKVDRQGVIFSGATREPVARGLTRPHSVRLHQGRIWVDNSGYGELGIIEDGGFWPVTRLPGWTRGLCFYQGIAFVGTSRVIPRFYKYAPGLDPRASLCGLHAVDIEAGRVLGSLIWPLGNQVFAIDWVSSQFSTGLPFSARARHVLVRERQLFYNFSIRTAQETKE